MQQQKKFYKAIEKFKERVVKIAIEVINKKWIPESKIVIENGIMLKFGYTKTYNMTINGIQQICYNEDNIKQLKREFKIYQSLFNTIINFIKTSSLTKLRVPLSVWIEYKGICVLALYFQESAPSIEVDSLREEKRLLQNNHINPNYFNFKKCNSYVVAYVKKTYKLQAKHRNILFQPPLDRKVVEKARAENASTSIESLQLYISALEKLKELKGICPKHQIIEALRYCLFCKKLRKIYRSSEGQINETHFFSLVLNREHSMVELLAKSGLKEMPYVKGILFDYLEFYFGVVFEIDIQKYNKKQKDYLLGTHIKPIIREYSVHQLELLESLNNFPKYLHNNQLHIAKQIITLKEDLINSPDILLSKSQLAYHENDYIASIKLAKQLLSKYNEKQVCSTNTIAKLPVYLLIIKAYSQFSESQLTKAIKEVSELIGYNYGDTNSILIKIWLSFAFYYQQNFHNTSLANIFIQNSQQLSQQLYPIHSKEHAEYLIELSKFYRYEDNFKSLSLFQIAKNILKSHGDNIAIINALIYQASLTLSDNDAKQLLQEIHIYYQTLNSLPKHLIQELFKAQYHLAQQLNNTNKVSTAIEALWNLDLQSQEVAVQLGYRAALKIMEKQSKSIHIQQYIEILQTFILKKIDQNENSEQQIKMAQINKDQAIIQLQQIKNKSLGMTILELILQSIHEKDIHMPNIITTIINHNTLYTIHQPYLT